MYLCLRHAPFTLVDRSCTNLCYYFMYESHIKFFVSFSSVFGRNLITWTESILSTFNFKKKKKKTQKLLVTTFIERRSLWIERPSKHFFNLILLGVIFSIKKHSHLIKFDKKINIYIRNLSKF